MNQVLTKVTKFYRNTDCWFQRQKYCSETSSEKSTIATTSLPLPQSILLDSWISSLISFEHKLDILLLKYNNWIKIKQEKDWIDMTHQDAGLHILGCII